MLLQVHHAALELRHLGQPLPNLPRAGVEPCRNASGSDELLGVLAGELGQVVGFGAAPHLLSPRCRNDRPTSLEVAKRREAGGRGGGYTVTRVNVKGYLTLS